MTLKFYDCITVDYVKSTAWDYVISWERVCIWALLWWRYETALIIDHAHDHQNIKSIKPPQYQSTGVVSNNVTWTLPSTRQIASSSMVGGYIAKFWRYQLKDFGSSVAWSDHEFRDYSPSLPMDCALVIQICDTGCFKLGNRFLTVYVNVRRSGLVLFCSLSSVAVRTSWGSSDHI